MLRYLANRIRSYILNSSGDEVNPATDEKLNELKSVLDKIDENTDGLELKADTINLNTDELENKLDEIKETIGQESGQTVLIKLQAIWNKLVELFANGLAKIKIWDGTNTALVTDTGRLQVDARIGGGSTERTASISAFGILKNSPEAMLANVRWSTNLITNDFTPTLVGSGSWSIANTTSLKLNSGASASSGATMRSNKNFYYQSGRGQMFKSSIILGDTGVAGNVREWGLCNGTNGIFIRLNGTSYEFVLLSNGVETTVPASTWDIPVTVDGKGHFWYIQFQWLGVGNYFIYYDGELVHTHNYIGTQTVVSVESPDLPLHFKNYNTTNTTDVYLKSGCASVVSEGANIISGLDDNNVVREARVTPTGRILVSQEPPTNPPDTTQVVRTEYSIISTYGDDVYTIPNGMILTLQRLSGGSEQDTSFGSAVELWYDPNGDGTDMEIIDVIFANGTSDQHDLNDQFTGDGTRAIRMRRIRFSGGSKQMFGRWEGYY